MAFSVVRFINLVVNREIPIPRYHKSGKQSGGCVRDGLGVVMGGIADSQNIYHTPPFHGCHPCRRIHFHQIWGGSGYDTVIERGTPCKASHDVELADKGMVGTFISAEVDISSVDFHVHHLKFFGNIKILSIAGGMFIKDEAALQGAFVV